MSTEPDNKWKNLDWLKANHPLPANQAAAAPAAQAAPAPALERTNHQGKATGPLHSPTAVLIATLLGSPVAGAAVMAINYRRLGQKRRSVVTIAAGIAGTAGLIGVGSLLPEGFPSTGIAIGGVVAMRQIAVSLQDNAIRAHVDRGGPMASNWRAAGIGMLGLVLIGAAVFAMVWAMTPAYGTRLAVSETEEIYYSDASSLAEAQALGAKLKELGYFGQTHRATVFLTKNAKGTAAVSFVVAENAWNDPDLITSYRQLGEQIAPVVGGRPLSIRFMNDHAEVKGEFTIE